MAAAQVIHILWEGPFSLVELATLNDQATDGGLYQIYGAHPVYGPDVLLYVGQTVEQTFAQRIPQHGWDISEDPKTIKVYVGRLVSETPLKLAEWKSMIDLAEKLTIHVNAPAYNATHLMAVHHENAEALVGVHVLNWGSYRCLAAEASGLRWGTNPKLMAELPVFRYPGA